MAPTFLFTGVSREQRLLLEHLGEAEAAQRLMQAIEAVTANPALHTGDLGGQARTTDVTAAVVAALRQPV